MARYNLASHQIRKKHDALADKASAMKKEIKIIKLGITEVKLRKKLHKINKKMMKRTRVVLSNKIEELKREKTNLQAEVNINLQKY